jgi:16S rRNA (adenine1518-N6/adenine1519-N6)-dimethyltransferase
LGRRLGQHFLVRPSFLEKIAIAACPERAELVLEIGPGKGALTDHLLSRADRIIAVEIDPVLVQYLRAKYRDQRRLEIVEADVLKTDLTVWGRVAVAGNLPYYITTPIVEQVLALKQNLVRAVFLVQKEVAERIATGPGSRDYGYLSVATQFYAVANLLFTIPPGAFRPPPKVDSAVIELCPRESLPDIDAQKFLKFVGRCFQYKRKTIRNNLLSFYDKDKLENLPEASQRAEQLGMAQFLELYRKLA